MNLKERGLHGVGWIHLAQDRASGGILQTW